MLMKCWRTIAATVCDGDTEARSMSFDSDLSSSNNSAISRCSEWVSSERLTDAVRPMPAVAAVNAARMRGGEKPETDREGGESQD